MTLPPVIHVTAIRNAVTPAGEWTATARAASTPYVPAAALAEAEARIKELEAGLTAPSRRSPSNPPPTPL